MDDVALRVNHEEGTFTTLTGVQLKLLPIPKLVIERLYNDDGGKPKIPLVHTLIAGQYERIEPNPNDPDYLAALTTWNAERKMRVIRYILIKGIQDDPPAEFMEEYKGYFPYTSDPDLKYIWVVNMLGVDAEDLEELTEAIVGQTSVTVRGLEAAVQSFPDDSERGGHSDVPIGQTPSTDSALSIISGGERSDNGGTEPEGIRRPPWDARLDKAGWIVPEQM